MKSKKLILSAILMAVSSTVMAQENIQKAFDALKQSKGQEETYTNHFLERDPDTGLMEGMSDEYEFKITDKAKQQFVLIQGADGYGNTKHRDATNDINGIRRFLREYITASDVKWKVHAVADFSLFTFPFYFFSSSSIRSI